MSQDLRLKAQKASEEAYSPYSKVNVGAAVETSEGDIYSGCNIENASFGGTVCAERVAIWKAVSEGKKELKKIYVYTDDGWPPCGLCLQTMSEFSSPELKIIMGDKDGKETTKTLKDLLPFAFTPQHME